MFKTPTNATLAGFTRSYMPRFKTRLGTNPTLHVWQEACRSFLQDWCPVGKNNGFKFIDATADDGVWTLSANDIARISYVTTYEYAHALLQFNASEIAAAVRLVFD